MTSVSVTVRPGEMYSRPTLRSSKKAASWLRPALYPDRRRDERRPSQDPSARGWRDHGDGGVFRCLLPGHHRGFLRLVALLDGQGPGLPVVLEGAVRPQWPGHDVVVALR